MEDQEEIIEQLEQLDLTLSNIRRTFKQIENKIDTYKNKNDELVSNLQPWINFFGLNDEHENVKQDVRNIEKFEEKDKQENIKNIQIEETQSNYTLDQKETNEHDNSDSSSLTTLDFDLLPETFKNEKTLAEIFASIQKFKKISINELFAVCKENEKLKIFLNVLINKKMIKIENDCIVSKK